MKKSVFIVLIAALMLTGLLSGCAVSDTAGEGGSDSVQIVTTIFPEYDWVNEILGEYASSAQVTMLLDKGVDLHSFQPTAEDILKISTCDLFIYVGGESDEWVVDALGEAVNKDMIVIDLLEVLGDSAKEEEAKEGMQEEDEEHEDGEDGGEEETEYDEHVWLSLKNAEVFCDAIADALSRIDPDHADAYTSNVNAYKKQLSELDEEYQSAVKEATVKTLLFGDRFPFRYMTDDYGLDYYAAFVGCSAETEASFETITFLSRKADELSLSHVITIEGGDSRIAETIVQNTESKDQQILTLNSMQSVTSRDVAEGITYLTLMEKNLEVIKEALK